MNADDLLDLAIGHLDAGRRESTGREVDADPALAERLERLTRRLDTLLDDGGDTIEPPLGLAARTIARVAERRERRPLLEFAPVRVPFRWADVAVAAGIFVAGLLTLLPAVQRGKDRVNQAACTFNLQQLGFALRQYSQDHGSYPYVPAASPASRAGTFAVLLHDSGLLPDVATLDCPGNGPSAMKGHLPHYRELCRTAPGCPDGAPCLHHIDYAYTLGYEHQPGRPGPIPAALPAPIQSAVPLLADLPVHDTRRRIFAGNSPNHGGHGQNVLFTDGHIAWHPTRRLSPTDDDMYLNRRHVPAPGVTPDDGVMVPGAFRFDGKY